MSEVLKNRKNDKKVIRIMSCGLKYGPPPEDASLVINCQGFVNPHYDQKLRPRTGACTAVADFLKADPDVQMLMASLPSLLVALVPGLATKSSYHKEIKLVFACTGGKHRSRFFAILAAAVVRGLVAQHPEWGCRVVINHRDKGRE
jgi:RNase adaptor protein for sRNA GlmZ degradation